MSIGVVCVACFQEKEKEKRIFLILLAYGLLHTFIVLFSAKKKNTFFFKQVVERQVESTSGSDNLYNFLKPHKFKFILSSGLEKM